MKEFTCKTWVLSGTGSLSALESLGARRLMVVADPFFVKNGWARRVAEAAGAEETEIFGDVVPDPTVGLAAKGTARVRAFKPDVLVALGGGSAMDLGKAMAFFAGGGIRLVMVPTTSGSGSEVTDFAVLTHEGIKHPLVDGALCPELAILDDALLSQLPPSLIADGGFDILSHASEGFVARNASPATDALAGEALRIAMDKLPASFAGDRDVRLAVHEAATMAGMAFTRAGLGLCHAMAHTLGGMYHVPHGRLNAILLPAVIRCNAPAAEEKYARLARMAGLGAGADSMAVRNLRNGLVRLRRELQLPATLKEAGVDIAAVQRSVDAIIKGTLEDPCCATNPRPVDAALVRQVLREVLGGG